MYWLTSIRATGVAAAVPSAVSVVESAVAAVPAAVAVVINAFELTDSVTKIFSQVIEQCDPCD